MYILDIQVGENWRAMPQFPYLQMEDSQCSCPTALGDYKEMMRV